MYNQSDTKLEDFEGFRFLKKGIQGAVYKAQNKSSKIFYAIKISDIKPVQEQDSLFNLRHENVMKFFNYWCQDVTDETLELHDNFEDYKYYPIYCTQMELCTGTNLEAWILKDKSKKSITHGKTICYQIASGMEYLHKQGIMHRDIKPANIVLYKGYLINHEVKNVIIKIGDLGSSKLISAIIEQAAVDPSTPNKTPSRYRCPQQKEGNYNEKTDVFSAGILIFELLYSCIGIVKTVNIDAVREGFLPEHFINEFPKEASLIETMLLHNAEERSSAKEVVNRLQEILEINA